MYKYLNVLLFSIAILGFSPSVQAQQKKDCTCPRLTCGPCQKKISVGKIVKFCDWGDINVCKKEVCENVNSYFGCLTEAGKKKAEQAADEKKELDLVYEDKSKEKSKEPKRSVASRMPLSTPRDEKIKLETPGRIEVENESRVIEPPVFSDEVIGTNGAANNKLQVFHRGQTSSLKKGQKLYVGDEISNSSGKIQKFSLTFSNGKVQIDLQDKTKVTVHDPHSIVGRFQPFLYLVHGGLSSVVEMQSGSFDLLAGQILTRASQGQHSVNYEMGVEGLQVKVESIKGSVDVIKAQDLSGKTIHLKSGSFVSWMSETPAHLFNVDEKQALAGEGFITPVFEMGESRKKSFGLVPPTPAPLFADWTKKKGKGNAERTLASKAGDSEWLCQGPKAQFQQCAWSCEGNAKGARSCEADKSTVHCVRRVCNAAGQWGVPTAFASSYRDLCPATGVRIGECSP